MFRLVTNTIKQIVFIPLFIFSSAALSQTFNWSDAIQMDDHSGVFVIPEGYTAIGSNAFEDLYATQIILPDSITTIASEAFRNNIYLESINIPNSVYSIGQYAFAGTKALKSIVIPTSINDIQNYTFRDSGLENFNSHDGISSIGAYAFSNTNLVDIDLNDGVSIGNNAFKILILSSIS